MIQLRSKPVERLCLIILVLIAVLMPGIPTEIPETVSGKQQEPMETTEEKYEEIIPPAPLPHDPDFDWDSVMDAKLEATLGSIQNPWEVDWLTDEETEFLQSIEIEDDPIPCEEYVVEEVIEYDVNPGSNLVERPRFSDELCDERIWVSSDGQMRLIVASDRANHRLGSSRIDGVPFYPWVLDILYDEWVKDCNPDILSFEMMLGLIIKESSGDPTTSVMDINGRRSSGLFQFNNHNGIRDGNAMAITPKATTGYDTHSGQRAHDRRDEALWFVEAWDPFCVQMSAERFTLTNQMLRDIGWSQQRILLAHRLGRYNSGNRCSTRQQREWDDVATRVANRITPWQI